MIGPISNYDNWKLASPDDDEEDWEWEDDEEEEEDEDEDWDDRYVYNSESVQRGD